MLISAELELEVKTNTRRTDFVLPLVNLQAAQAHAGSEDHVA